VKFSATGMTLTLSFGNPNKAVLSYLPKLYTGTF
jgi:hypothetical protein